MTRKMRTAVFIGMALTLIMVLAPVSQAQVGTGPRVFTVATADLDGDGNLDLVTGHDGPNLCWHFGNGNGTFGAANCMSNAGVTARFVAAEDINDDTKPDIIVADFGAHGVRILTNSDGTFTDRGLFSSGASSSPRSLVVADFDGDGKKDVITANAGLRAVPGSITFFKGNGDGTLAAAQTLTTAVGRPYGIAVADFNGDSKLDIAVSDFGPGTQFGPFGMTIYVLTGNGDGTFSAPVANAVGRGPRNIAAADINGDGCPDLVSANQGDQNMSVLLNMCDETGTFAAAVNTAIDGEPFGIAAGDLDGDAKADVVLSSRNRTMAGTLLSLGDGTFADPAPLTAGTKPIFVALVDINNDGNLDALIVNTGSTSITVLLGNGDGTFGDPPDKGKK